ACTRERRTGAQQTGETRGLASPAYAMAHAAGGRGGVRSSADRRDRPCLRCIHTSRGIHMFLNISHIGQIALAVGDVDRAEAFYRDVLGLRKLYRFGDLTFFDCAGVRLMLEKAHAPENI